MRYAETKKLLGTSIEIVVASWNPETPEHIEAAFGFFHSVEREFSRFLPDSELSLLNASKKREVSPRFLELLEISRQIHRRTNGFFNPLVSVSNLGYSHTFESNRFERSDEAADVDFSRIEIRDGVVLLGPGQSLDFGGIAKGWAVDGACALLRSFGHADFLVNAGGDVRVSGSGGNGEDGWVVGVENPFSGGIAGSFVLRDAAVATSGSYKRKWNADGGTYHHLVNPRTGANENAIVSVTLVAPDCATADGFTKAAFNAPIEEGIRLIESNGMEGFVFTASGQLLRTRGLEKKYGFALSRSVFGNPPPP